MFLRPGQLRLKLLGDLSAISLSTAKISVNFRSKVSAQRWALVAALTNCTFTRTWSWTSARFLPEYSLRRDLARSGLDHPESS